MKVSRTLLVSVIFSTILLTAGVASAQIAGEMTQEERMGKLSMTLTPPLYQLNLKAGETWSSVLKLVNSNPYDLTIYTEVQNFLAEGDSGNATFLPFQPNGQNTHMLASWVTVSQKPIIVKRDTTVSIPFTITVPPDAEPGGHYAGILVGTQPQTTITGQSGLSVGSMISSLLFVRVPGDVIESGEIRDFYAVSSVVQKPDVDIEMKFENKGNVHIIPRGNIVITNMWGKERGVIEINEHSSFGNVLPNSLRKFSFEWKGEESIFEAGRYSAIATLMYGDDTQKTVFRTTYFWVLPWKPVLGIVFSLALFGWFVMFAMRRYIARAVALERSYYQEEFRGSVPQRGRAVTPELSLHTLARPLAVGTTDLRRAMRGEVEVARSPKGNRMAPSTFSYRAFMKRYRFFFLSLCIFALGIGGITWYFIEVFQDERVFEVVIKKDGKAVTVP